MYGSFDECFATVLLKWFSFPLLQANNYEWCFSFEAPLPSKYTHERILNGTHRKMWSRSISNIWVIHSSVIINWKYHSDWWVWLMVYWFDRMMTTFYDNHYHFLNFENFLNNVSKINWKNQYAKVKKIIISFLFMKYENDGAQSPHKCNYYLR